MPPDRNVSAQWKRTSEREQLDLFRALPDLAPPDAQDLMAYLFFSLAKSKRVAPIDFRAGTVSIRVEAVPEHFDLTGGLERWLHRVVRKHGADQSGGWRFDFVYLHAKSGSLSPLKHFAYDLREIVCRQTLPGYELVIARNSGGAERLTFAPTSVDPIAQRLRKRRRASGTGENL